MMHAGQTHPAPPTILDSLVDDGPHDAHPRIGVDFAALLVHTPADKADDGAALALVHGVYEGRKGEIRADLADRGEDVVDIAETLLEVDLRVASDRRGSGAGQLMCPEKPRPDSPSPF